MACMTCQRLPWTCKFSIEKPSLTFITSLYTQTRRRIFYFRVLGCLALIADFTVVTQGSNNRVVSERTPHSSQQMCSQIEEATQEHFSVTHKANSSTFWEESQHNFYSELKEGDNISVMSCSTSILEVDVSSTQDRRQHRTCPSLVIWLNQLRVNFKSREDSHLCFRCLKQIRPGIGFLISYSCIRSHLILTLMSY